MPASFLPRIRLHRPGLDVLTILCGTLIAVHVVVACFGGSEVLVQRGFYEVFGLSRDGILQGKLWQLVTHAFLHGGWIHLLFNWIVIFMIGGRVYHILGARGFLKIYFGGVLLGSVLHLLLHPAHPIGVAGEMAHSPLVGASAGAMALLLALTSLSPDSRMWPLMVSGKNLGRGLLLASVLLYVITPGLGIPGLSNIGTFLVKKMGMVSLFQMGHIYHLGGGLVGLLYVRRLLRRPISLEELQQARARREGVSAQEMVQDL